MEPRLSNVQCELIGEVMVHWSRLESNLDILLWRMVGVDAEDGRVLTSRTGADIKIQMLRALARRHLAPDPAALTEFNDLLAKIEELKDDRNFIAHATWATLVPDEVPIGTSIRQKSEPGRVNAEKFPQDRMKTLIDNLHRAVGYLVQTQDRLSSLRGK